MAKLPRYVDQERFSTAFPTVSTDGGGAAVFGEIAEAAAGLGRRLGQMADRAARKEGVSAGLAAGLDGEFRPVRTGTIRGDAYDEAGIRAALEVTEAEIGAQLEELALAHRADPEGLSAAIDALQQERFTAMDPHGDFPEMRASLTGFIARSRTTHVREALRQAEAERIDRNRAALETGIRNRVNSAGRAAYVNGLDETADAVVAGEIEAVRRTLTAAVNSQAITAHQAARTLADIEEDVALNRVQGTFDRLESPAARQTFLKQFRADYAAGRGPLGQFSPQRYQAMDREFEKAIERDTARAVRLADEIENGWEAMENAAAEGLPPRVDAIARQRAMAVATDDPAIVARAELAQNRIALARDLQTRTPVELGQMQGQLQQKARAEGLTDEERQRHEIVVKVAAAQERALKTQPYQWGMRAGALDEAVALNFSGDAATVASLRGRLSAQRTMRGRYGDVPFFEEAERNALKYIAEQGGEQMTALAGSFVAALGKDAGPVLAEISADAPVLANIAGLAMAGGRPDLGAEVAQGIAERRAVEPGKAVQRPVEKFRQAAGDFLGGAYMRDPAAEDAVMKTARVLFEMRARAGNISTDLGNDPFFKTEADELWSRTLDEAAGAHWPGGIKHGGVAVVNGSKVIAPPDMAAAEVQQRLRTLTDSDLAELPAIATGNTIAIGARDLQGARLVNVGDGRYLVALGDPASDDPRFVAGRDGDFWILDIRALKRIQQSRPRPLHAPGLSVPMMSGS